MLLAPVLPCGGPSGLAGLVWGCCCGAPHPCWGSLVAVSGPCCCLDLGGCCGDAPVAELPAGMNRFLVDGFLTAEPNHVSVFLIALCVGS